MTAITNAQPEGKVQTDATKAVNDPDDALGAKAAKATKKDTTIPQKGGQDKMDTPNDGMKKTAKSLAAGYDPMAGYSDDEIRELCHSADHDCATFVEHPVFGKGKPIKESHAIPDKNGYVAWYDVQFKHGVEEKVMAEDMQELKRYIKQLGEVVIYYRSVTMPNGEKGMGVGIKTPENIADIKG